MGFILRGLKKFAGLGNIVITGAHNGIRRVADEIKYRLQNITPDWYGPTVITQELELGRVFVGPTGYNPERERTGAFEFTYTCPIRKYKNVTIKVRQKTGQQYLTQVSTDIIASGYAKKTIVDSIVDNLRRIFG